MRRVLVIVVVARLSSAWVPPAPSRPTPRRATENDDNDEDSSPLAWLRSKRDTFEPKWSWLKDRRDFSDVVRAGRRAEREQLVRGQRAIKESISRLAAPGAAGELLDFLEGEVRKERAVRNATLIFIKDEWAREEALRRETRAREEALRESALRFVDDEWAREDELRRDARAFVVRSSARIKSRLLDGVAVRPDSLVDLRAGRRVRAARRRRRGAGRADPGRAADHGLRRAHRLRQGRRPARPRPPRAARRGRGARRPARAARALRLGPCGNHNLQRCLRNEYVTGQSARRRRSAPRTAARARSPSRSARRAARSSTATRPRPPRARTRSATATPPPSRPRAMRTWTASSRRSSSAAAARRGRRSGDDARLCLHSYLPRHKPRGPS